MKVTNFATFYEGTEEEKGYGLVFFSGEGDVDGVATEILDTVSLDGATSVRGWLNMDGNAVVEIHTEVSKKEFLLNDIENQETWANTQAGIDACTAMILGWKKKSDVGGSLPDPGDEGDVLTVVEGEWASAASSGGMIDGETDGEIPVYTGTAEIPWVSKSVDLFERVGQTDCVLTPDAVGDNPITVFYEIFYYDANEDISLPKIFATVEGDDTTKVALSIAPPAWAVGFYIYRSVDEGATFPLSGSFESFEFEDILGELSGPGLVPISDAFNNSGLIRKYEIPDYSEANDGDVLTIETGDGGNTLTFKASSGLPDYSEATQGQVPTIQIGEGGNVVTWQDQAGGLTSVTYEELMILINGSGLTPGSKYLITDFATRHYILDDGNQIFSTEPAAAPSNVAITPDAVGDNPVTYYGFICFTDVTDTERSYWTEEITWQEGDSTTETILSFDASIWANKIILFRGTESGIYTHYAGNTSTSPVDIYTVTLDEAGYQSTIDNLPIAQVITGEMETVTGENEGLIVLASTISSIDSMVVSTDYPNDIIHYDPFPSTFETDPSFSMGAVPIDGFKGVITYRKDTINNIEAYYDWRHCKIRLWGVDFSGYTPLTEGLTIYRGDQYSYDNNGTTELWEALSDLGTTYTYPPVEGVEWTKLFDASLYLFNSSQGQDLFVDPARDGSDLIYGSADIANYEDVLTIDSCSDVHIGLSTNAVISEIPLLPTRITYCFLQNLKFVNIGDGCHYIFRSGESQSNLEIGRNCSYIWINSCSGSRIGDDCHYDYLSNAFLIGSGLYDSKISGTVKIGDACNFLYAIDVIDVEFGNDCASIILPPDSIKCKFENGYYDASLAVKDSTIAVGEYNKTYSIAEDGTPVVIYINSSYQQVISTTL